MEKERFKRKRWISLDKIKIIPNIYLELERIIAQKSLLRNQSGGEKEIVWEHFPTVAFPIEAYPETLEIRGKWAFFFFFKWRLPFHSDFLWPESFWSFLLQAEVTGLAMSSLPSLHRILFIFLVLTECLATRLSESALFLPCCSRGARVQAKSEIERMDADLTSRLRFQKDPGFLSPLIALFRGPGRAFHARGLPLTDPLTVFPQAAGFGWVKNKQNFKTVFSSASWKGQLGFCVFF